MGQSEKVRNTGLREMLLSTSEYKQGPKNFKSGLRKNALVDLQQNLPSYSCQKQTQDQSTKFEGTRGSLYFGAKLYNMKSLEGVTSKSWALDE